LGGNLGDRLATLRSAVDALANGLPDTRLVATSPVYETRPVGPSSEPFLNAVVELRTLLSPHALLGWLLRIEQLHGRQRHGRWGARTLDLDLLLVDRRIAKAWEAVAIDDEQLQVPHPRLTERDFVLTPLVDLRGLAVAVRDRALGEWLDGLEDTARTVLRRVDDGLRGGEPQVVRRAP
jgi:2-amino-4-hydroxy-6-hydroxymethyldihydropteridine diphosphokinase